MHSNARELVPELLFLGLQIPPRRCVGRNFQRQPLGYREAVSLDADELARIITQKPHRPNPQLAQNLNADAVIPLIGLESEPFVGFDRVEPLVLQLVGANLVREADSPSLLVEIQQNAAAFLGDSLHRRVSLLPAVATDRMQAIARETRRV